MSNDERMKPEEAIETLKRNYPSECYEQLREAVDIAITALEENSKLKAMADTLADCLDGTPLPHPCGVPPEFCKEYCMGGEAEPSKELWLKWAEVMASE